MIDALLITWAIYFGAMGVFVLPAVLRPDKVRLESAWWGRAMTALWIYTFIVAAVVVTAHFIHKGI